jgi:hypothetical protein
MNSAAYPAQSATQPVPPSSVPYARGPLDEEDLALGWECANPALQIEVWRAEGAELQPQHLG